MRLYDQRYELIELPRTTYIANTQRLINKVQDYDLLKGANSANASNEKNKVEADVWQSFGWNNSRRNLTKHNDVKAWWNDQITNQEFERVSDSLVTFSLVKKVIVELFSDL